MIEEIIDVQLKISEVLMVEVAIPLTGILAKLGWSRRKFFYRKAELLDAGVIFYRREGRPPVKKIYAFSSRLERWISLKASKREVI